MKLHRALSLLLDRLSQIKIPENAKLADTPEVGSFAQLLTTAALDSKSETELDKNMEKIRGTGHAAPMGQVFRALGWNLPGWTAVNPQGEVVAPEGRSLQAMNKIVALAPDSQERAKRWGEMIYAAIEQLNEGRLAQTVSILEAAKHLIAEKHPDPTIVPALATFNTAILPEKLFEAEPGATDADKAKSFAEHPVGTGPFIMKSWEPATVSAACTAVVAASVLTFTSLAEALGFAAVVSAGAAGAAAGAPVACIRAT